MKIPQVAKTLGCNLLPPQSRSVYLNYQIKTTGQNPSSEAISPSASPVIPAICGPPQVHYRVQNIPPPVPVNSKPHANTFKIHFTITLPSHASVFE
jgi:hypothetical protein